jgi:alanyl-tRNA synthetase
MPEIKEHEATIIDVLTTEEKQFRTTLDRGVKEFKKLSGYKSETSSGKLTGETMFTLFDTYGFPTELSLEEAHDLKVDVDKNWQQDFDKLLSEQKERSRTATAGQFKGGLGDHSDQSIKYHTATHLMYESLRRVLGPHVIQRGSNITPERLRFDFSHDAKMTPEQIAEVEKLVNEQIAEDLTVTFEEHPTKKAREELHALGQFGDRYGDVVKIYRMQKDGAAKPYSFEICGGPHVGHTGVLADGGKKFRIKKEESSSSGIRRIKAVLE